MGEKKSIKYSRFLLVYGLDRTLLGIYIDEAGAARGENKKRLRRISYLFWRAAKVEVVIPKWEKTRKRENR